MRRGGVTRTSTGSPLRGKLFSNASQTEDSSSKTISRLYQGLLQFRKFRNKEKHDSLPHHHTKDNVHIQIPLRMMISTLSIFLLIPLLLFGWRQLFHPPTVASMEIRNSSKVLHNNHNKFPTWMDEIQLPPEISDEAKNETTAVDSLRADPLANDPVSKNDSQHVSGSQKEEAGEELEERIEQVEDEEVEDTSN